MKSTFISCLLLISLLKSNAQNTNCSPTLSEIYDFEVGDEFIYGIKENPGGGGRDYWQSALRIVILDKITSGDTTIYYRERGGAYRDTLIVIDDSSHHLNQCDLSLVNVNSFFYYEFYNPDSIDIYTYIKIYDNDTVRTWDNDYPRSVKAITNQSIFESGYFIMSDSNTYEPISFSDVGMAITIEYAAGAGIIHEDHFKFESHYIKRLIHKINGTDTTFYHTASTNKSQLQPLEFSAFPNPVKNTINLEFQTSESRTYSISNSFGKIIMIGNSEGLSHTIDLTSFSKGIYFLNSTSKNENGTIKFIKE